MTGLERRIKEKMERQGYDVAGLMTYSIPEIGNLTVAACRYKGDDVLVYLINSTQTNPLVAQEILAEHLRKNPRGIEDRRLVTNDGGLDYEAKR